MITYNTKDFDQLITSRIDRLRREVIAAKPIVCSERAKLVTEAYSMYEDKPVNIKRALVLKHILDNITQNIWDGELIVGSHGGNGRRSAPIYPEFAIEWLEEELDEQLEVREQDTFDVPQSVKEDLKAIFPYWKNKTVYKKYRAKLPEQTKKVRDSYMFTRDLFERNGYGHTSYNVEKLLSLGFKGIKKEVEQKLKDLDYTKSDDLDKKSFYEGLIITLDSASNYCKRYGDTTLKLLETCKDEIRKKELLKISEVCHWIANNPARDLYDALQLIQFVQLIIQLETSGDSVSPGRLDQILYPYFKNSLVDKGFDLTFAQELIDCFWLKLNEIVKVQDSESIRIHPGFPLTPNITVGGQTREGKDGTNALSYLMLTAQKHIRLTNPQFTARVHKGSPEDYKIRLIEIIELGTGMPALFGDEGCIDAIRRSFPDMSMDRVRDYGVVGCVELAPRGFQGRVNGGFLNVARLVDLAINDGVDRLTGNQIGVKVSRATTLNTFEDVLEAFKTQAEFVIREQVINAAVVDQIQRENTPHLFLSSLIEGCIENGKDMTQGGSLWGATPILHVGEATASNSLTAIKDCVFDKKLFTMKELKDALDENFVSEKGQIIQKHLLSSPIYGNDDDYADDIMRKMTDILFDITEAHKDIDGRPYTSMILTLGATVPHGWKTAATADGRKSTTPVSDSMSPSNLGKSEGPTAILHSASKIDQKRILEGNVLNLKFNKAALSSKDSKVKLCALMSTYFNEMRGQELQMNVVDGSTLRAAQDNPEAYSDLIVRIAGYSARFVELAKELQDDIIAREEHANV